ncbi:hypothetical protein [Desulforamulus hydrothermalis]|uniref:Arsenite S-adenosylmethyltransferase n=1 Tax=Desulforamulus hydrothermalis Lam5 = DSM 18033 TaxID=1121428 RepID=K8EE58_9FIRM|nr:hypothetical protein [Desulforamulus hydrothermalis]CCO07081.1 hypothetical protein DESHY_110025 [Desulforamulus hydrothermalis Lam5 = DSM 18033]SHH40846.1 hypothetical protein SAMN02745177_02456 [Desulforamulus hydrothermalis Lam5 = DSM 18033]
MKENLRELVKQKYAQAITQQGCCCGSSCCEGVNSDSADMISGNLYFEVN